MEPNGLVIIALLSIGSTVLFGLHAVEGGVPLKRYESLMKQESPELGLYNASDKVVVLTDTNFKAIVLGQNHSSLVEFYNSYCGHCRRFAPYYKMLADELYSWRDILTIGAIDCAAEENNDICREYEVMAYPSLRYFGLDFQPSASDYGKRLETQDLDGIRTALSQWIVAENSTKDSPNWPNFHNLSEKEADDLLEGIDKKRQYTVLVYEAENSTIGIETILHFQRYPDVQVRRVTDTDLAAKFQIDDSRYKIAIVDKKLSTVPYSALAETSRAYKETIESYLRAEHVTAKPDSATRSTTPNPDLEIAHKAEEAKIKEILKYVHSNKHLVYQADLEMAVRSTLFNEIPKVADISGEKLLALQRYLAVLQRYNPLGPNGRSFVSRLYEFVMQRNQHLNGKDFEDEVNRLDKQLEPIFSAKHYVGCSGSKSGLRGFTCSVWQLFHFMTVQAANNDHSQDPLEVLQAMHGFVKYFFGCTDCSEHFQAMATRRKIWSTPNKDEAVLWLWAAHNEVNQRLAGDATEDPEFPKIQFPSRASCSQCYKQSETSSSSSAATLDINWNKDAVLSFLRNIHNPEYVSRFGVENENVLQPTLEKLRQKRMIGNVFSDMDMRMGMLLYGFCILMMVVAFKLFAFKGYRKKPYGHDLLGKV